MTRRKITEEDCLLGRVMCYQADVLLALEAIQGAASQFARLDQTFALSVQLKAIQRAIATAEASLVPAQYDVARLARLIKPEGREG